MGYVPIRRNGECCSLVYVSVLMFNPSEVASSQDEMSAPAAYLDTWLFFNIAGDQILLPFLALTLLFSRAVTRHPTVITVCVTWIVAGIVSSLL